MFLNFLVFSMIFNAFRKTSKNHVFQEIHENAPERLGSLTTSLLLSKTIHFRLLHLVLSMGAVGGFRCVLRRARALRIGPKSTDV